ncbi:MAG: MATE family efflux transporter [Alphaproteobacteria bacterium]|nr:MATE family efflux transporter [Alphaproteobacteria bacterium]
MPAEPLTATPSPPRLFWNEALSILRLALPVIGTRAGLLIMMTVDTAMVGHADALQLAFFSISLPPQTVAFVILVVLLSGTSVLIAQARGAGDWHHCGQIWRIGLVIGLAVSSAIGALLFRGDDLLRLLGQSDEIAAGGGAGLRIWALSLPGMAIYAATTIFLEALRRPLPGLIIVTLGNIVNAGLAWALVHGQLGAPTLGALGAVTATTVTRWSMAAAAIAYVLSLQDARQLGVYGSLPPIGPLAKKVLRLGIPFAIAAGVESSSFMALSTYAGWLGPIALGSYQIGLNILTTIYMTAIGVSVATSIHVGLAVGRGDRAGVGRAGWAGLATITALMTIAGLAMWTFDQTVIGLYTSDATISILVLSGVGIIICGFFVDGAQAVLLSAARGAADVAIPTLMFILCFPLLMAPLGFWLGPRGGMLTLIGGDPTAVAVTGLWWSCVAGLGAATILLALRFHWVSRQPIRRI